MSALSALNQKTLQKQSNGLYLIVQDSPCIPLLSGMTSVTQGGSVLLQLCFLHSTLPINILSNLRERADDALSNIIGLKIIINMKPFLLLFLLLTVSSKKAYLEISKPLRGLIQSHTVSSSEFYFMLYHHSSPSALFSFESHNFRTFPQLQVFTYPAQYALCIM